MNTLLNTISAQITYTRGALIALFAGLFILAACGGGGAVATDVAPDGGTSVDCETNGYGAGCEIAGEATRVRVINACIDAIKTGEACDVNIPMATLDCLNEPFTDGCSDTLPASVTIASVQETRKTDCRTGTVSGATCTGAIVNVCGAVTSTIDGVLFTETLCGDAYNARRSTLVTACVDAVEGGETREDSTACASVVISTDSVANEKALDCVLDPLGEGCDTNDDVMKVIEKTDDTIKSIDDEKTDRVAFCRGASDFAQNPLCMNAITATCAADPFTQTTGDSPANFCADASRTALITRCSDADDNNNAGCDTVNVSAGVTVETCVDTPYAAGCSDAVFEGLKTARYNHCIGETPTDDCALVETSVICVADGTLADPFHAICRNAGTYTQQQTEYCTTRTGMPVCAPNLLTSCAENPFEDICTKVDFYTTDRETVVTDCALATPTDASKCTLAIEGGGTVAACITDPFNVANGCNASADFLGTRTARTTLCTTDSTLFDDRCNGFTNTVTSIDIATTRDNICNTEATSFHAGCLGRTDGVALAMRKAFVQTCLATPETEGCDTTPTSGESVVTVALCIINPHREECKDDINFAEVKSDRTTLCTDTATYFDGLCDVYENIDTMREARCTTGVTSFDTNCKEGTHGDVLATQVAFAKSCRTSSHSDCIDAKIDASGSISVAACVNSNVGTPFQGACLTSLAFEDEREARSLECAALIMTDLDNPRCTDARRNNLCINNPFDLTCDAGVYETTRDNRDTYCLADARATDDTLCAGRHDFICDGTDAGGNPFADICGTANHVKQIAFCGLNGGSSLDTCESQEATACQANPFNSSFGAYRFDCTDSAYFANRIPACSGAIEDLPNGGTIDDCAVTGVADVICANSGELANPFAKICAESEVMNFITGFNQDTVQEEFCGDTRKAGDCTVVYTRLCTGANLVEDSVGEGGFDCLADPDPAVIQLRNAFCVDATTTFNPECKDGTHGLRNAVNNARKNLADTCSTTPSADGCDTHVNGGDSGPTVADCSDNRAVGDPYQEACVATEALKTAFEDERTTRATFCSTGANVNDDRLCQSAREADTCIHFPYGKVTDNSADCDPMKYVDARTSRDSYCNGASVGDNLCVNRFKALCDGEDSTDDPFGVNCVNNTAAQRLWCGVYQDDPRCATEHAGSCLARPFDTITPFNDADDVNCLTHGGGETYRSQRQLLCAKGTQGDGNNCDTTEIAPVVCGTSTGVNSNPFAAFCADSANDGQDATALLATRQATLSHCKDTATDNSGDAVCKRSSLFIANLDSTCADGATSITAQCAYTQYSTTQKEYCAGANSNTIFDANCEEGTHGGVLAARRAECGKTGSVMINAQEVCGTIVSDFCTENDINVLVDKTAGGGYLCEDKSGTAYADMRERVCGTDGEGGGSLTLVCAPTLALICTDADLIGTAVGEGRYNCRTSTDTTVISARQDYCALTANAGKSSCAPTLTTLCTGDGTGLVETASNGYVCSASTIDTVIAERRRFCATSAETEGCPVVLAGLCTGADSLLNGVDTGGGVTYDCKDDITTQAVVDQRRAHCAQGTNDNAGEDCRVVIDTLCTGKLVQIDVPTGVLTGAGMTYNCATSEVQTVKTARETHCRLGTSNTGGLCTDTIATLCGDNPFEKADNGDFGSLCVDVGDTTYADARKLECRNNGTAVEGQTGGKCATLKEGICDGNDVGDSPYADVCGMNNADNQEAFCRLSNHSTTVGECVGTIATVCDVTDGDPFDTLCGTTYHNDRATRCRQSILATGQVALPADADCTDTIALACAGGNNGGATIDANPFDTICFADGTYDGRREALCRPGGGGESNGGCGKTITNYCGEVNAVNTANLFDSLCTIGTTYDGDRTTFCTMGETIFDERCKDGMHGDVTIAQKAECLKTGSSDYNRGDVVCPMFVTTACANPFTKQTANTDIDLCTGDNGASDTYENIRLTACSGNAGALPSDVALCSTSALSGAICGDGIKDGVAGTNPFADICSEATGNIYFTGLTDSQRNACRTNNNADGGNCTTTIEGFCGTTTTPTTSNNLFDTLCNTNYETARNDACLDKLVTAGADNGNNDDCNNRQGVKSACQLDPFAKAGCATVEGRAGFVMTYCTETNIFHARCLEGDIPTYGDVKTLRDNYCRGETAIPADGEGNGNCVSRKSDVCGATATHNPFANLCKNDGDNATTRVTFCMATAPTQGDHPNMNCADTEDLLCPARPFGTGLGTSGTINCNGNNDYADERKDLVDECLKENPNPAGGATCTDDIVNCIANPFRTDAFVDGEPCDAAAFINAFLPHCEKPENAWEADCNAYESMGRVMATRMTICETEKTSFRTGCEGSAYESPERTLAREALALTCVDTPATDDNGCNNFVNGVSGTTVAECSANPFSTDKSCFENTIFEKQRVARINLCKVAATSFDPLCDILEEATGTDKTRLDPITMARVMYCRETTNPADITGNCVDIKTAFCDGDEAGDKPHAFVCGTNVDNQKMFCRISGKSTENECLGTVAIICHVEMGNPFDEVCPNSNNADRETRANACRLGSKSGNDCPTEVVTCNTTPFEASCNADVYAGARTAFCTDTNNVFNAGCTDTIYDQTTANRRTECLKLGTSSLDAGDLICPMFVTEACTADAFTKQTADTTSDLCTGIKQGTSDTYENIRLAACNGVITALPSGDAALCNTPALSGAICGNGIAAGDEGSVAGTNPFAKICSEETGNYHYAMLTAAQQNACRTSRAADGSGCTTTITLTCEGGMRGGVMTPADPFDTLCEAGYASTREALCRPDGSDNQNKGCAKTITNYCGTDKNPHPTNDIFNTLCNTGYETARQNHCLNLATIGAEQSNCGEEGTDNTILGEYCKTGQNVTHCPAREIELAAFVNTLDWETGARNSDNTADLIPLESVGADDASDTNYVKAGTDGLNLGVVTNDNATITDGVLMLSEAGVTDAPGSGVAFARIDYSGFTAGSKVKYYAGILSGTDLGEPLVTPSDPTVEGVWNTALAILVDDRAVQKINTKLYFNFMTSTFKSKNAKAAINVVSGGFGIDKFFIDGGFTTDGIVYGTTKLGGGRNSAHSDGTLTGLIGQKGLVAAFVSDGAGNSVEYAGGLVADNPDPAFDVDCSLAGGNAFDTSKCLLSTRATLCRARRINSVRDEQCQTAEIRGVICVAPGESDFANVFDSICNVGNGGDYTALRISLRCTTQGNYADLADRICDTTLTHNFEAERRGAFCIAADAGGQANPFHSVCGEEYAVLRQTACAGQPVDVPSGGRLPDHARCTDPITTLCEAEPFNPTAGVGDTKFDCLGASDNNYVMVRQVEIGLCVNGTLDQKAREICADGEVTKITSACHVDTGDPFASACSDYAEQYMMQRETRLIACRLADKGDVTCTNAISTICTTGDTPFADICHKKLAARKSVVGACLDVVVANEEATASGIKGEDGRLLLQPIPASCNVMVVAGKTVLDCINDPFNSECDVDTIQAGYCPTRLREAQCQKSFYAATAKVCETSTTSFTAECLDPANGFVGVRQLSETATSSRALLVARCSDTLADGMPNTTNDDGCDTVIVEGVTSNDNIKLADCIKNPFLTECRGGAVASALANSADAVKIRDAFVVTCEGFDSQNASDECKIIVAGGATVEFCTKNPFNADCSGNEFATAFNRFRADDCTTAATSFNAGCKEDSYSVTETVDVINPDTMQPEPTEVTTIKYRDTARAERALGCADPDDLEHNNCTDIVSGSLTIDMCNADPFAVGCESPAFINARLEACKNDDSPNAACSVAGADNPTNYVSGLENGLDFLYATNEEGTDLDERIAYVKDDPKTTNVDESAVYQDGVVAMDHLGFPIADNDETPIDESRVLAEDIPGTPIDESKKRITHDDPNTFIDETRALVDDRIRANALTLNDVGYTADSPTDQSASGFALVYIPEVRDGDRMITSESRYYTGLLSDTDVGPEFHNSTGIAAWTGKLSLVSKGVLSDVADFTLDINFDTRTIGASDERTHTTYRIETYTDDLGIEQERSVVDKIFPVKVDYAHTTLGQFFINGKFTTKGVIYGTTKLVNDGGFRITKPNAENGLTKAEATSVLGEESSRGSLTGVIGQNGAVGAFISSGSGNTFGEYAGGFVAAPEFNCLANPLDIRCVTSEHYEAREDACSGTDGWENSACDPVFERVCNEEEDNLFLSNAKVDGTMGLDCLNAPNLHEYRKSACDTKIGYAGDPVPDICTETVDKVCMDTLFDDLQLCHRVAKYQDMQYTACSAPDVRDEIFNRSTTSARALDCLDLISIDCGPDPFDNRFCYISNNYNNIRVDKCSDHNFAATQPACTGQDIAGAIPARVNVIKTYCDGLTNRADDTYNLCDNTADYLEWRDADNDAVTGWNAAEANDTGLIAGDADGLNLGGGATSIHNELTLTLGDSTTNGVAIASAMVGGQLQSYGGLLSGADVGIARPIPSMSIGAAWSAQIALLWQDGDDANRTTILRNEAFSLSITFATDATHVFASDILLMGADNATFTLVSQGEAGKKLVTGRITLKVGSNSQIGDFRGLVGETRLLAAFASTGSKRTGANAFAGGLVAEELTDTCVPDGTGNPITGFDNNCSVAQKRDEATRCYNERGNTIHTGDCLSIGACFANSGSNLFGIGTTVRLNNNDLLSCTNDVFEGARAIYCRDNPSLMPCNELIGGSTTQTRASGGNPYSVCIGRPFGAGCEVALGSVAFAQSRLALAVDCMTGDNSVTKAMGTCQRFNAAVVDCATNPFGVNCATRFTTQVNADFAVQAQISRLSHCTATGNEASDLCTGALTHCAGASPNPDCGTLVADYCLGGAARAITGNIGACTDELATTCEMNPFADFERCEVEQKYIDARLEFCEGDGTTVTGITLASCKTDGVKTGLDLAICGNGTSGGVGTNPFAPVCQNSLYNDYHGMLNNAQEAYCSDSNTNLDEISDCGSFVTSTCGTGGFGYTTNPNKAFDPLCRQETYDYARLAVCTDNSDVVGCDTFIDKVCPDDAIGLIGCDGNANSTPASVWNDDGNALGRDGVSALSIVAEGAIRQLGGTTHIAQFAQAGIDGLDLSAFAGTPAQYKLTLEGDDASGVAIAHSLRTHGGSLQFYAGLLRGTNVGGPLVNNTANGNWAGKARLSIGSSTSDVLDFTLNVTFTGNGGTLTTQQQTSRVENQDILTFGGATHNLRGARLRIDGAFNPEGVIYGTTELYHTLGNSKSYETQRADGETSIGTLTGLIGKTGAVGAFVAANSKVSNIVAYVGGFTATPTTPHTGSANCGIGGTPLDATDCPITDYPDATARAVACLAKTSFIKGSPTDMLCKSADVLGVICAGASKYANPFNTDFCPTDYTTTIVIADGEDVVTTLAEYRRAFVNRCDTNIASATACSSGTFVPACLDNPYRCGDIFTDVRTRREAFCGRIGNGADVRCTDAVRFCIANNHATCGEIVQTYCFAEADRDTGLCAHRIQTACTTVNPWGSRCNDAGADVYLANRIDFCSSQTIAQLTDLGVDLRRDCRQHAEAICGYYVAPAALSGPRPRLDNCGFGGNREHKGEVIEIGSNPYADICTNSIANAGRTVELTKDEGGICPHAPNTYNQIRQGADTHKDQVLAYYIREFCPVIPSNNKRIDGCPEIDRDGGAGYEAWQAALGAGLISAGDAASDKQTPANFIAGYGGALYLGVGNGNVANSKTFRLNAGANGFAYATTGTQLFTGLLSGTTNLGAAYTSTDVNVTWRSTLSFLTNQSGVITAIEKEGFVLTLNYNDGTGGTITGTENVGTGMVFEVAGTFTGNLLSGTVIFGEADTPANEDAPVVNTFKLNGMQSTGILTGVIGADGAIGVFKSNTGGHFGDFAGGFITAPATDATESVWRLSFGVGEGNYRTDSRPIGVKLHSSGVDLRNTAIIADGASSFIRLNANNEIFVNGAETQTNPDTGELEYTSSSNINSLAFFNNSGLITPDNGASGVSFGRIKRAAAGSVWLAGLWPTTNMGLPLTAQPTTAIWRGRLSTIYLGTYSGEKDARFTITFNTGTGGGTIVTTEPVFVIVPAFTSNYILIDADFDSFGAISGSTSVTTFLQRGGVDIPEERTQNLYAGRVSGLIGAKGLIGAFVSNFGSGVAYAGGFYALNPDAPRSEEAGAPTSFGIWENSILPGGVNSAADGFVVNNFGGGADVGTARFARLGTGDYIAADVTDNSRTLLAGFADETVKNNGVGFGKVGEGYYSGLLAGADVGLSLTKNQEITTAATWTGKIALFGPGNGLGGANHAPDSAEQDLSLEVTFDGTDGTIDTIAGNLPEFGNSFDDVQKFQLTIDATFNAAGVISGTTSFYGFENTLARAVSGELTGLIGTRGAIGSFISTGAIGAFSGGTYAGTYAGGFVVQNPDYELTPEIPFAPPVGDIVNFDTWKGSFASGDLLATGGASSNSGTHFVEGVADKITPASGLSNKQRSLLLTDAAGVAAGGVAYLSVNGINHFAGLLNTMHTVDGIKVPTTLGGALTSPPRSAIWKGSIGVSVGLRGLDATQPFNLHVTFDGSGGRVRSSGADSLTDMANGDYQFVHGDYSFRFDGTFTDAGVMTGTVESNGGRFTIAQGKGVFTGIIGIKGALGVFRNGTGNKGYAGGFTAQNPSYSATGVTADYNLWRVSFNSRGVNRQVTHPIITDTKLANPLQPRGVNVNQFLTGTTHFVQGEADGLNLTGSNKVTGAGFTPTLLTLADGVSGIALWQDDINVADALSRNIQGYVGLLSGTDVGGDPLAAGRTTYTGKIIAYVGDKLSPETDFTLNINYGENTIDAVAELLETRFQFDGRFNFLGVITGDVLIGADGVPGSFNGLLGTESAIGVFKNTLGSAGKTFIGGFAVIDPFVNHPEWLEGFASGGANAGQTLLKSSGHFGDAATEAGTHFIRATSTTIRGATTASVNHLSLTGTALDGGVAFVQEISNGHQVGYTGLLSTTNVGLPLENNNLDGVWSGKIQAYVGATLSAETDLNLTVGYAGATIDGTVMLESTEFTFDGNFDTTGVMFGNVLNTSAVQGSFNGLIGQGGAVGAFKNNVGSNSFVGGFVVKPTQ